MMISELYDALKEAGATDEKARAAASAVAAWEDRFDRIERQILDVRGTLTLHGWMISFNIAISLAVLWKILN